MNTSWWIYQMKYNTDWSELRYWKVTSIPDSLFEIWIIYVHWNHIFGNCSCIIDQPELQAPTYSMLLQQREQQHLSYLWLCERRDLSVKLVVREREDEASYCSGFSRKKNRLVDVHWKAVTVLEVLIFLSHHFSVWRVCVRVCVCVYLWVWC